MLPTAALMAAVACLPVPDTHPHCAVRRVKVVTAPEVFADRLMATGFELHTGAKSAEALVAFDAARCLDPARSTIPWGRALALAALGRHDESADEYARMLSFDPTDGVRWQYVALGWVGRGRYDEAEACFVEARRGCVSNAERFEAHMREALFWAGASPTLPVTRNLRGTGRADTSAARLAQLPLERVLRAERACTHALAFDTDGEHNSRADAHRVRGMLRYQLGQLNESVADAEKTLDLMPSDAPALHLLALVAMRRCDWPTALAHIDVAARCGLAPVEVAENRCWVFGNSGESGKAEQAAREWCRLDPASVDAVRMQGALLRLLGKDDEADRAAERAAELTDSSVLGPFLDQVHTLLSRFEHRESAFRTYARLLARPHLTRGQYLEALSRRADLWRFLGQQTEAFDDLTTAVRLAPANPRFRELRLVAAESLNREREVLEDAAAMRRLLPVNAEARTQWQRVSGPEELRAAMAGREPDYRPAGPMAAVPIVVSLPRMWVAGLGERKRGDVRWGPNHP